MTKVQLELLHRIFKGEHVSLESESYRRVVEKLEFSGHLKAFGGRIILGDPVTLILTELGVKALAHPPTKRVKKKKPCATS